MGHENAVGISIHRLPVLRITVTGVKVPHRRLLKRLHCILIIYVLIVTNKNVLGVAIISINTKRFSLKNFLVFA